MATCSPSELLASGSCFQCLTKKELQIVIAQLLCEIQAGGGGGSGPKVYRALLTQSGTDAPVATVLENTLGGEVVWSYPNTGVCLGVLIGGFPFAKTFCMVANPDLGRTSAYYESVEDDNTIKVITLDMITGEFVGGRLYGNAIEILVYP